MASDVGPKSWSPFSFWGKDTPRDPEERLRQLAEWQGVKPIQDPDELVGDFWPEEESTEEFLATLRAWRREGRESDPSSPS